MKINRVVTGRRYVYHANFLDRVDGRTGLKDGEIVTVVQPHGCPRNGTMGHCFVEQNGSFVGLVHCNSLHTFAEYRDYLRREIAVREAEMKDRA